MLSNGKYKTRGRPWEDPVAHQKAGEKVRPVATAVERLREVADLAGCEGIEPSRLAEALQYRPRMNSV